MSNSPDLPNQSLGILTLGAIGVVYGDIGTSPLYAFREALAQSGADGISFGEILGVLSLALWALIIVVTLKYVAFLTRMDNNGEGGVLSLMALARRATGGGWRIVLLLGATGAALFYGDAIITPALSVLSAVEGLRTIPGLESMSEPVILGVTVGILCGLFAFQARGTAGVAALFGPICLIWFVALAALGLWQIAKAPGVLAALNPMQAIEFLHGHGVTGLFVLGAVFLTVTGAEALIADMGHFGRLPIQLGWLGLVWPALTLNYLGQGALALQALAQAEARGQVLANADWFFLLAPDALRAPLVVLATAATVIASQAVITGAFSLTHQATALGLLPRLTIRQTSAQQIGQIYLPAVNWILLGGVAVLVFAFRSSSAMAAAYGIAVTGTMVVTTCLAFIIAWRHWHWDLGWAALLIAPFLALDVFFFGANILRVTEGGWVPLVVAGMVGLVMVTWLRGRRAVTERSSRMGIALDEFVHALSVRPPVRIEGTAVFLTQDLTQVPAALLHNLKHNKALHRCSILLRVETLPQPWVAPDERLSLDPFDATFVRARLRYGYMDRVDVPSDLARSPGLLDGPGGTSFFVGRSAIRFAARPLLPRWMTVIYMFLHRNAADPTAYFNIPPNRVVELGSQIEL
ncbi:potassium transporter Kup [Novosphingobium flavum]|uniref:Probable potassium transport system protein Kup n=1 Tax=Novosphingobium aerophilum TaxID=2839843 RepID=A0A7X1F7A4_9SPHN|nr:potassium transporter Kup [Novosphingobium aerophilum]MBC2651564.1 potassium transporter Kup [Novosphingobium aerophilum]MBC2661523.1 potassium transporter Kup [Novosphingobium aerophilum]